MHLALYLANLICKHLAETLTVSWASERMSKDAGIVDYSRSRRVTLVSAAVLVFLSITLGFSTFLPFYVLDIATLLLLLLALILGWASKRAIDYLPGEWHVRTVRVTPQEYREMVKKHMDAYGHLISSDVSCACVTALCLALVSQLLVMFLIFMLGEELLTTYGPQVITAVTIILNLVVAILGYSIGYKWAKVDPHPYITEPPTGYVLGYVEALADVPDLDVKYKVKLAERDGALAIADAEPAIGVKGMPDELQIKVQVSVSSIVYPYLVASYYKGPVVEEHKVHARIRARYPALFEYSMDGNVTIVVARFDIPSHTRSVPHISDSDFRKLGRALARVLLSLR